MFDVPDRAAIPSGRSDGPSEVTAPTLVYESWVLGRRRRSSSRMGCVSIRKSAFDQMAQDICQHNPCAVDRRVLGRDYQLGRFSVYFVGQNNHIPSRAVVGGVTDSRVDLHTIVDIFLHLLNFEAV